MDVTPEELECFSSIVPSLTVGIDGQLNISSIAQHILQQHTKNRESLQLNRINLESLIISHASFPFIRAKLTADALCRSLLLLTNRCESNFKQQVCLGGHKTIRTRTPSARLRYIFSALTNPPSGVPTQDDVLDVLCRVKYPAQLAYKGQLLRKPVTDLAPLAERLQPCKEQVVVENMSAATMQQLRELVEAFPSPYQHLVVDTEVDTSGSLRVEDFVKWALQVYAYSIHGNYLLITYRCGFLIHLTKCLPSSLSYRYPQRQWLDSDH